MSDIIFQRHSIPVVKPDPIPRDTIELLLNAGAQAPNHHRVRPWRFIVLEGTARERLGDIFAQVLSDQHPGLSAEALAKERAKPLRAPLIIAVGVDVPDDPRVVMLENICAAAAAAENILLEAVVQGLAGMWRTGAPANDVRVKQFLGLQPEQPMIAFLYIGYPAVGPKTEVRPSFEDRTVWMSE
jgi:nitroreductase